MVLYIYLTTKSQMKLFYGKIHSKMKNKCCLIFLDKLVEVGYNELIKNEEWFLVLDDIYFLYKRLLC